MSDPVLSHDFNQVMRGLFLTSKELENDELPPRVFRWNPERLPLKDFLQLRALHRQFRGRYTPGLPLAVQAARLAVKKLKIPQSLIRKRL